LQESQALAKGYSSKLSELEMKGIDLSAIVFRSAEMERMIETALRVARTDSTVFLLGESGVGKGMIAKLIHKHSERKNGPFIRVDCAGIPDSLLESELFGYERGAFTGAKPEGKPGLFELANGGTLFLDEVAEIPLSSQSKLLRFLEDHEIIRVGGTKQRQINVRIIAATNKNVEEMVSSKLFRRDLYYRLNVVPIQILPLRERREDILALILHFLDKFNRVCRQKRVLSPEVVEALYQYDFQGNVRELANLMERLVVLSEKDRIEKKDLPKAITACRPTHEEGSGKLPEDIPLKKALEEYECSIIHGAMKKYGSQREVAKRLRVAQATISRKMKKHLVSGIDTNMNIDIQ
jgi:transcriptional regulator with PAS, ATPase and Fis domain